MTNVVSRRPLTTQAWFRCQLSPYESYGKERRTATEFYPRTSVLSRQYHSTSIPHLSPATCCSYQQDKRAKNANLQKKAILCRTRKALEIKVFSICV
jgi:hypothetical protein